MQQSTYQLKNNYTMIYRVILDSTRRLIYVHFKSERLTTQEDVLKPTFSGRRFKKALFFLFSHKIVSIFFTRHLDVPFSNRKRSGDVHRTVDVFVISGITLHVFIKF